LRADSDWLAEFFEPIEVAPASEEMAVQVLHGIKMEYEKFHNVSYAEEALTHAVLWASRYIKAACLPGAAVQVIDRAGATAQLRQPPLPEEVLEIQKRIRFIVQRMQDSIANHEFEKARFYSNEGRKEREKLNDLRKKYKFDERPALNVGCEDVQRAVSKLTSTPIDQIR
jgi:ATP-dependent Clp protease ATP-binding subunit ClpC